MAYPDERVYTEVVVPGRIDDVVANSDRSQNRLGGKGQTYILEAFVIASTIETNITSVKVMPDIMELLVQLRTTLACTTSSTDIRM